MLRDALALHEKGRIAEAAAVYREILKQSPNDAGALHLLGVAELQSGNTPAAIVMIRRAAALEPRNALFQSNLGLALSQTGDTVAALEALDRALALAPDSPNTLNHRGNVLRSLGRHDEAVTTYDRALTITPNDPDLLNNRGAVLLDLNRIEDALASFGRALAANPNHTGALANRGALRVRLGEFDAALSDLSRAIALDARNVAALNSRGNAFSGLKRHREALFDFDRAVAVSPDYADGWFNRASVLNELMRWDEALQSCDRTLAFAPNRVDALVLRGQVLRTLNRPDEALRSYDLAVVIDTDNVEARVCRGHLLADLGRLDAALGDYERALARDPEQEMLRGWRAFCKLRMCDWRVIGDEIRAITEALRNGKQASSPAVFLALSDDPGAQLKCARQYVLRHFPERQSAGLQRRKGGKIRTGYFSADFHDHATAHLTAAFFEQHDRTQFETFAFSFGPQKDDAVRKRVKESFNRFVEVRNYPDTDIVRLARECELDIAIDMKGFTEGSRTGIFAMRAAPVQASWLGYPGTMGAPYMDYLIADVTVAPELMQSCCSEKFVWLPHSYQPNDNSRSISAALVDRKGFGLPRDGFVFCCFNNSYKIMPALFAIWVRLLQQVDGSVLWLLQDNEFAVGNLRAEANRRGVDPNRLVFANRLPQAEHLARHRLADLFLDTVPYNAHTTASDALWAGLPVLTCPGQSFQGRVGASLLRAAGLPELIAPDLRAYEALALELACGKDGLRVLRDKLRVQREHCPLFNTAGFARNFEAALSEMYDRHCRGLPPQSFHVTPYAA